MGNVSVVLPLPPQPIEAPLPWGPVMRGLRWGNGPGVAWFLHEPGRDIDAWRGLPAQIARSLSLQSIALDLPGHGLSDDPWEPSRMHELVRYLLSGQVERSTSPGMTLTPLPLSPCAQGEGGMFVIAAGCSAFTSLLHATEPGLSGLVCLSPRFPSGPDLGTIPPRTPHIPKLLFAGSRADGDLATARRLATTTGGWAVVNSVPVVERGTELLATPWQDRIGEAIVAFLRDCRLRTAHNPGAIARRPR